MYICIIKCIQPCGYGIDIGKNSGPSSHSQFMMEMLQNSILGRVQKSTIKIWMKKKKHTHTNMGVCFSANTYPDNTNGPDDVILHKHSFLLMFFKTLEKLNISTSI